MEQAALNAALALYASNFVAAAEAAAVSPAHAASMMMNVNPTAAASFFNAAAIAASAASNGSGIAAANSPPNFLWAAGASPCLPNNNNNKDYHHHQMNNVVIGGNNNNNNINNKGGPGAAALFSSQPASALAFNKNNSNADYLAAVQNLNAFPAFGLASPWPYFSAPQFNNAASNIANDTFEDLLKKINNSVYLQQQQQQQNFINNHQNNANLNKSMEHISPPINVNNNNNSQAATLRRQSQTASSSPKNGQNLAAPPVQNSLQQRRKGRPLKNDSSVSCSSLSTPSPNPGGASKIATKCSPPVASVSASCSNLVTLAEVACRLSPESSDVTLAAANNQNSSQNRMMKSHSPLATTANLQQHNAIWAVASQLLAAAELQEKINTGGTFGGGSNKKIDNINNSHCGEKSININNNNNSSKKLSTTNNNNGYNNATGNYNSNSNNRLEDTINECVNRNNVDRQTDVKMNINKNNSNSGNNNTSTKNGCAYVSNEKYEAAVANVEMNGDKKRPYKRRHDEFLSINNNNNNISKPHMSKIEDTIESVIRLQQTRNIKSGTSTTVTPFQNNNNNNNSSSVATDEILDLTVAKKKSKPATLSSSSSSRVGVVMANSSCASSSLANHHHHVNNNNASSAPIAICMPPINVAVAASTSTNSSSGCPSSATTSVAGCRNSSSATTTTSSLASRQESIVAAAAAAAATVSSSQVAAAADVVRLPLKRGWRRQTCVRTVLASAVRGDVLYYSPCGRKMASLAEIARYLKKHDQTNTLPPLPIDCFTFSSKIIAGEYIYASPSGIRNISESEIRQLVDNIRRTNGSSTSNLQNNGSGAKKFNKQNGLNVLDCKERLFHQQHWSELYTTNRMEQQCKEHEKMTAEEEEQEEIEENVAGCIIDLINNVCLSIDSLFLM